MKSFKLSAEEIKKLIPDIGACLATDKITVEGLKVGFMYREEPFDEMDNGWRILSGTETEDYMDNPRNSGVYDTNTIANYDPAIIPYLHLPVGTELERAENSDEFRELQ